MPTVIQIAKKIGIHPDVLRYHLNNPDAPPYKMEPRNHKMTRIYNEQEVAEYWEKR